MNSTWKNFLISENAVFDQTGGIDFTNPGIQENGLFALSQFGLLKISGVDAADFLQGQITCNVHELSTDKSCFTALCSPKGRVISTFLLVRPDQDFLLVMPLSLLETVRKTLQRYVLRAKAKIEDISQQFCLMGVHKNRENLTGLFATNQNGITTIELATSVQHQLVIAEPDNAIEFWQTLHEQEGLSPCGSELWNFHSIGLGLPWLNIASSEHYIPQMLNLDRLGGISFNKGCYTGQEVVARTHFLGQAKRHLTLVETAPLDTLPAPETAIIDISRDGHPAAGKIISAACHNGLCKMLAVMAETANYGENLKIAGLPQNIINLLPL